MARNYCNCGHEQDVHHVGAHTDDGTACKRCGCARYEPRGVDVSEPRDLHTWQVGELTPGGRQYWDCVRCRLSITTDVGAPVPRAGCVVRAAPAPAPDLGTRRVLALERIAAALERAHPPTTQVQLFGPPPSPLQRVLERRSDCPQCWVGGPGNAQACALQDHASCGDCSCGCHLPISGT